MTEKEQKFEVLAPKTESTTEQKKPDDKGGFYFSSHITIKDPNTDEVLVKMRAD